MKLRPGVTYVIKHVGLYDQLKNKRQGEVIEVDGLLVEKVGLNKCRIVEPEQPEAEDSHSYLGDENV